MHKSSIVELPSYKIAFIVADSNDAFHQPELMCHSISRHSPKTTSSRVRYCSVVHLPFY